MWKIWCRKREIKCQLKNVTKLTWTRTVVTHKLMLLLQHYLLLVIAIILLCHLYSSLIISEKQPVVTFRLESNILDLRVCANAIQLTTYCVNETCTYSIHVVYYHDAIFALNLNILFYVRYIYSSVKYSSNIYH